MRSQILERPALVLNRHWRPIHVTTVVRALVLLWNDSARVVETSGFGLLNWEEWASIEPTGDEPFIRAGNARLRVPEVICLTRFERMPTTAVAFSRRNMAKRDHHTCQYCGVQPGWSGITIDHVLPRSKGGASSWTNCVAACSECNARKADRTPEQAGMKLRRRPSRPEWRPHYSARADRIESWSPFLKEPAAALQA